ncbi:hypothetical protein [Pseudomonas ogarae]|uniref:hypothetical protein n=1 Tax=Pseudomonas ogarae (strain DSM 112162 / CECT 30235 / F113) TaxID=1114970 RepID=UPI00195296F8|nr:hypothetical protein [Pseudomonas ogarae]
MKKLIRTIALGTLLQIAVGAGLTAYLFDHANDVALQYAQMAERNASAYTDTYTDEQVLQAYNRILRERSQEREDLHAWVDRRIELKLSQQERK